MMAFLSYAFRHWLWFSVPSFLLAVLLLVLSISGVVRTVKQARLFSVPLLERQEIEFSKAGRVVLCVEGPRFTRSFSRLEYELQAPHGAAIPGRVSLFRARTSGISKVRMELAYYRIPYPGRYLLKITGLKEPDGPDDRDRLVFMRPHLARSLAYVSGILFSSALLIGSVVLFGMGISRGGPVSMKVPLIAAAVVLGISAVLWLASWSDKRENRAIRDLAAAAGWTCVLSRDDPGGIVKAVEVKVLATSPEIHFDARAVMTGKDWGPGLYIVRGAYRYKDHVKATLWRCTACLVELDRFRGVGGQVDVRAGIPSILEDPFAKFKPVDMVDPGFSREFTVYSRDPVAARNAVDGSLRALLLERKGTLLFEGAFFMISIGPGGAVLRMDGLASLEEMNAMVDLARRIRSAVN